MGSKQASIWTEAGMENESHADRADFWRRQLLASILDLSASGSPCCLELEPVLWDTPFNRGDQRWQLQVAAVLSSPRGGPNETLRAQIIQALEAQVRKASDVQLVNYAEKHYARLPSTQQGWGKMTWGLTSW